MIYYVEDDDNIRGLTLYALRQQGIEAEGFSCDSEFKAAVARRVKGGIRFNWRHSFKEAETPGQ